MEQEQNPLPRRRAQPYRALLSHFRAAPVAFVQRDCAIFLLHP